MAEDTGRVEARGTSDLRIFSGVFQRVYGPRRERPRGRAFGLRRTGANHGEVQVGDKVREAEAEVAVGVES